MVVQSVKIGQPFSWLKVLFLLFVILLFFFGGGWNCHYLLKIVSEKFEGEV